MDSYIHPRRRFAKGYHEGPLQSPCCVLARLDPSDTCLPILAASHPGQFHFLDTYNLLPRYTLDVGMFRTIGLCAPNGRHGREADGYGPI